MRRRLLTVALALTATLLPLSWTYAQKVNPSLKFADRTSKAERAQAKKDFQASFPLLSKEKELHPRYNAFPQVNHHTFSLPGKPSQSGKLFANAGTTIWANLAAKSTWTSSNHGAFGYYSFSPTSPIDFTSLYETDIQSPANHGVQYKDGHLYGLNLTRNDYGIYAYLYNTDTNTGTTTSEYLSLDDASDVKLIATETAQAKDGTVYGEFYNESFDDYEWGIVDYSTKTRTTIGPATNTYVALGITKEGQLYGIAFDGNLYKIDKERGTETLVGPTGISGIVSDQGQYYGQTGEIDQRDNTFYWAALTADGNGGLYEVNLETGAATLIDSEPNQLFGMYIPAPSTKDGAPATVTNLQANFEGTNLTGTIAFNAPSTTYGGAAISGDVTYTVKANGSTIATGTAAAGAAVSVNYTAPVSGTYNFEVTTSNSAGESPSVMVTKWIGFDQPLAVSNLTVSREDLEVTVSWTAPTEGAHGGILGDLTYDVYRISGTDTTKVASDIDKTTYVDDVEDTELKSYIYAVRAKSGSLESPLATSAGIIVGDANEPDWTEKFDSEDEFKLFTIVDANKDGTTWRYDRSSKYVRSYYNTRNGNDDWLFTPPIHLTSGRLYNVSFKIRNASSNWPNTFEAKWGTDTTAAAMTNTIVSTFAPAATDSVISVDINPTTDGDFYIGFHDNTEAANQFYLILDSISVTRGAVGSAPQAVTNLTVTPGEQGALQATLSFGIPTLNVAGNAIDHVDSVRILRDGTKIATLPSAVAGSTQTYTDNAVPTNGIHKYEVTPYIGQEFGVKSNASAFIGQDVPGTPKNASLIDNVNNVLATWDAFTTDGANGGYVNPNDIKVSFFTLIQGNYGYNVGDSLTSSAPGATSVVLPQDPEQTTNEDGTTQTLYQVAARSDGDGGSSSYVVAGGVVIGPSIKLPFKESMKGGDIDNGFAWLDGNDQWSDNNDAASWILSTDNSADGDGGSVFWQAYSDNNGYWSTDYVITPGDEASFNTPKISLSGSTNPKLYFNLYATANDPAQLKVQIQTPDGTVHDAKTIDLSSTTTAGWTGQVVDLGDYASQRYIIVKFRGIAAGSETVIGIDNINVFDQLEYNLRAAGINTPSSVKAGKSGKVDVYVENYGAQPASGYSVVLYSDDKAVDTVTVNEPLAVFASDTVSLTLPVTVNQTEDINVKAKIVYDNDLDEDDNNTETKVVKVNPSEYTTVNDLKANQSADGVDLTWSVPTIPQSVTTTEDFESYDAWATQFGDWTLVDGDKGRTGGFFQGLSYPGQGTAFAFDIFNPGAIAEGVLEANPGFTPHSGNQFAGAPFVMDESGLNLVDADNWLISPELPGNAQTIKFYAFNVATIDSYSGSTTVYTEDFDVLYSTTDTEPSSFTKIDSYTADGSNILDEAPNWKEITVQIPEGAKYFAIHHKTSSASNVLFGIDDITYQKSPVGVDDSIVAYNIYRDGEFIGTVDGNKTTFTDDAVDEGNHVYNITVVYQDKAGNRNESGFSNNASITVTTGIADIHADKEGAYNVYTIDGKAVMLNAKSLDGLKRGVYIINDKKYIVK